MESFTIWTQIKSLKYRLYDGVQAKQDVKYLPEELV